MKRICFAAIFVLLFSFSAQTFAQGNREDSTHVSIETNSLKDNWFINGGIGGQFFIGKNTESKIAPALRL